MPLPLNIYKLNTPSINLPSNQLKLPLVLDLIGFLSLFSFYLLLVSKLQLICVSKPTVKVLKEEIAEHAPHNRPHHYRPYVVYQGPVADKNAAENRDKQPKKWIGTSRYSSKYRYSCVNNRNCKPYLNLQFHKCHFSRNQNQEHNAKQKGIYKGFKKQVPRVCIVKLSFKQHDSGRIIISYSKTDDATDDSAHELADQIKNAFQFRHLSLFPDHIKYCDYRIKHSSTETPAPQKRQEQSRPTNHERQVYTKSSLHHDYVRKKNCSCSFENENVGQAKVFSDELGDGLSETNRTCEQQINSYPQSYTYLLGINDLYDLLQILCNFQMFDNFR